MQVLASIEYTKLREIGFGQGMNSRVYLADEPQLGGQVAVKEIEKANFFNATSYFEEAQRLFASAHRNVVAVRYACQTPAEISLVMPYYKRGSLTDRIGQTPLRLSEVLRIAQGVLAGLARVHLVGNVHLDIRPSNILFSDLDVPMVADFGQARAVSSAGVVTVPGMYTNSMPPETRAAGVATIHADLYQVGLSLYRALNGDPFFSKQIPTDDNVLTSKIASGKFPDRRRFMPHVPKRLRTLVRKALRVDAAERFQSATEMADIFSRVPLSLDWETHPLPNNGLRWLAKRQGHCDLAVELVNEGADRWGVQSLTENPGTQRRAKDKGSWRSGLTSDSAHAHLTDVFARLSE